jgi:DNA repair exonuclease SbcCD nuclease subunit
MKLIHCSDLHLDSKMEHNLTAQQARERNHEICATFSRLVAYATQQHVDAVLLAGDLFDTQRVSTQTAMFVLDTVRSAGSVEFFYLRGNHDESRDVFAGMELPDNFKAFGPDWTSYRLGCAVITGLELNRDNWSDFYDTLSLNRDDTNIVLLHGQISTQPGEETIALPKLKHKHIDYLALGHIHSFQLDKLDDRGSWCYCGCLEGRGFDECGEKGFVLLTVQDAKVQPEFVPFASRSLHEADVDITDCLTVNELFSAITAAADSIPTRDLVKFTLRGSYSLETQKDLRFLQKMLDGRFYFSKIKDESTLRIRKEDYAHDASLKGEFIRTVLASDRPQEEKEQIILLGIRALSGEEVAF